MKYLLLIHQGTAPTPYSDDWQSLGADEQKAIYADYQAINQTPGRHPGLQMEPPETATTVRGKQGNAHHGRAVRGGEEGAGRLLHLRAGSRRRDRAGIRVPAARLGGAVEVRPLMEQ